MNLTGQQMFSLSHGAEGILEKDGAIFFSRFTEAEMSLYLARPEFISRAESTAGIRLEFTTDATSLFLSVTSPSTQTYYNFYAFDIQVNGKQIGQLTNLQNNPENGHYWDFVNPDASHESCFPLGDGKKQVRIYFPWSMNLGIRSLELTDATFADPVRKNGRLLIYGDSITQGAASLYPSQTYASLIGDWLNMSSCNKGVGSEIYYPELAEQKLSWEPDIITVAYGINDWCTVTEEKYKENCRLFWTALQNNHPNAKMFALTPIWYLNHAEIKTFGPFQNLAQIIHASTSDIPNVNVIDCTEFVSHDHADFGDLWVHPNHIGFDKFFQNLSNAMKPYL